MIDIDFETNPITEEEVIAILGQPERVRGNEMEWMCPSCMDSSKDNLKFNREKHVIKCFACDFGQEITGIIARRRYEANRGNGEVTPAPTYYTSAPREKEYVEKEKEIPLTKLPDYYYKSYMSLMTNKDILRKMWEKHTIMPITAVECGIGYDKDRNMLVFPSHAQGENPTDYYDTMPNGAEFREVEGDKKIRRISGYTARICRVYGNIENNEIGIICEGYKDAYNLYQLLKMTDKETLDKCMIFTVQNGTNSLNHENCLQKINWHKFKKFGVLMDNDDAGDKATELAQELFHKMIDFRPIYINGYNDVQERFKKEFGEMVDIEKALQAKWLDEFNDF